MRIVLFMFLLAGWFLTLFQASAGFDLPRKGTVAVPLGGEQASDFGRSLSKSLGQQYELIDAPLPEADMAKLRMHEPFRSMADDQERLEKWIAVRKAVLDAIDTIRLESPQLADCLLLQYRNRKLCIAFGGNPNVSAEIREDGRADCDIEPINLYRFPCPPEGESEVALFDPGMVRLMNSLAHEALHALQEGYHGPDPQTNQQRAEWALVQQCREVEASQQEVDRLSALIQVLEEIIQNDRLPEGSRGPAARIGATLLRDPDLNRSQRAEKAREVKRILETDLKPKAQQTLDCRSVYKRYLELYLDGQLPSDGSYNDQIKRAGWFRASTIRRLGEFRLVTYLAGGAQIAGEDPPRLQGDRRLRQITPDGETVLEVDNMDFVSDLLFLDNYEYIMIAGDDMQNQQGVIAGYYDTDRDGLFESDTKIELVRDADLFGGLRLNTDPLSGDVFGLNLHTSKLYRFQDTDQDELPDSFQAAGSLGNQRDDLLHFEFSSEGFRIFGYPDLGIAIDPYFQLAVAERSDLDSEFNPTGTFRPHKESIFPPSVAEMPWMNRHQLRVFGTPGSYVEVHTSKQPGSDPIGMAQTDSSGGVWVELSEALDEQTYYLKDASYPSQDLWSTAFGVPKMEPPQFFSPKRLLGSEIQLQFLGVPGDRYRFDGSQNLKIWEPHEEYLANYFGTSWFASKQTTDSQCFYRAYTSERHVLWGRPDHYVIPPGVEYTINPNFNDVFPQGATFEVPNPPYHEDIFQWDNNGMVWLTGLTKDSSVEFEYNIHYDGKTMGPVPVRIDLDLEMLIKPPVGPEGKVQVPCLVLDGEHYPTYQFTLANSPKDVCEEPHWHASRTVYPLENPQVGREDPDPFECGFGTEQEVPQKKVPVSKEDWEEFLFQHIPPF